MYFGEEVTKEMSAEYQSVRAKLNNLVEAYILRNFKYPRAREHASQGFPRRLKVIADINVSARISWAVFLGIS